MKSPPRFSTVFSKLLLAAAFAIPGNVCWAAEPDAGAANPEPAVKPNLPASAATTSTPVENSVVKVFSASFANCSVGNFFFSGVPPGRVQVTHQYGLPDG